MRIANRYTEAFKEHFNVVGLATAIALSAATLNPLPLLAGLVAEAAYLIFLPDSKWYDVRLAKRYDAEVEARRRKLKEQVFPTLRPQMQEEFTRLEEIRHQMNPASGETQPWMREVLRKLDYLLEKFLMFASKDVQFRAYLRQILQQTRGGKRKGEPPLDIEFAERTLRRAAQTRGGLRQVPLPRAEAPIDPGERWVNETVAEIQEHYDREIASVQRAREQDNDVSTQAVLDKRLEVLERRKEFVGKMAKILVNLNHQLELVEDTFGLISDEIRARSPEQILADIEDVVGQTDTMTKLLEEVAPYEQMVARMTV